MQPEADLLERFCAADDSSSSLTAAIVVAHPDDEVIGAGGRLPFLKNVTLIHITDGAPRNSPRRQQYAKLRRQELEAALSLAGIRPQQACQIGVVDQEASLDLAGLTRQLSALLNEIRPDLILTHPYEGGHPDHDATALAVHAACGNERCAARVIEFTSYHNRNGNMQTGEFLKSPELIITISLPEPLRGLKSRMMDCFVSQQQVLRWFPIERERFRLAPRYDFTQAPHPGQLYYEQFEWGMTGERWRKLAGQALDQLGINYAI